MRKGVSLSFLLPFENKGGKRGEKFFRGKADGVSKERFVKRAEGERRGEESPSAKGDAKITRRVKGRKFFKTENDEEKGREIHRRNKKFIYYTVWKTIDMRGKTIL